MTHAATIDLGRNAQTKKSGSRFPAVLLTLALVVATIAAVWFASSAGLIRGTATKPVGDRAYDQIEAQRGAIVAPAFVKPLPWNLSVRRGYPVAAAAKALPDNVSSARRGYPVAAAAKALPGSLPARQRYAARIRAAVLRAQPDNVSSARRGYPVAAAAKALPDNVSSARRGYAAAAAAQTLNLWSWRGHAAGAVTVPDAQSLRGGYWVQIAAPPISATSGTFHLGR
jgi:hypothetical protein